MKNKKILIPALITLIVAIIGGTGYLSFTGQLDSLGSIGSLFKGSLVDTEKAIDDLKGQSAKIDSEAAAKAVDTPTRVSRQKTDAAAKTSEPAAPVPVITITSPTANQIVNSTETVHLAASISSTASCKDVNYDSLVPYTAVTGCGILWKMDGSLIPDPANLLIDQTGIHQISLEVTEDGIITESTSVAIDVQAI